MTVDKYYETYPQKKSQHYNEGVNWQDISKSLGERAYTLAALKKEMGTRYEHLHQQVYDIAKRQKRDKVFKQLELLDGIICDGEDDKGKRYPFSYPAFSVAYRAIETFNH